MFLDNRCLGIGTFFDQVAQFGQLRFDPRYFQIAAFLLMFELLVQKPVDFAFDLSAFFFILSSTVL